MNKQVKADLALVFVTMTWGLSYFMMDVALTEMGPFTLNACRFFGAFLLTVIFAFPKLKGVNKTTILHAAGISVLLLGVYTCSTFGVKFTSISNAGFLCSLSVLFIPILAFIFKGEKPSKKLLAAIVICTVGIALLTLDAQFQIARGDIICICGSCFASVYLMFMETSLKKEQIKAFHLSVFLFGFMGLYCTILSFLIETPKMPQSFQVAGAVAFLSVICTAVALLVQTRAQQYTSASHVGVIFCLEPIFSAIVAYFLAGEVLLPRAYGGAVMMIFSVILMEVDFPSVKKFLHSRLYKG
ncbi:MAG: DMT family transporter [Lachnospiraceae bacterium]|jgi:drug/metabolite transporter (DMT)-like permease